MLYRTMHNRWLRLLLAVFGTLITAFAINVFIVPMGLYSGGLLGFCQVIRTILTTRFGFPTGGVDLAGVLYFVLNIPLFLIAYKALGKKLLLNTLVCTVSSSLFLSLIPSPAVPIVEDMLTSCLLGGIVVGVGSGLVLTCGCSSGGLDIIGLYLSKKGTGFTVGKFSISVNAFLYALCLILFEPSIAIYSVIYNTFSSMMLDRMHQQNITVQAMIFSHEENPDLPRYIMEELGRGVTYWTGKGGYTGSEVRVFCVCLSKYEIDELRHAIHEIDPNAFFIIQEGVTVDGNFVRRLT